MSTEQHVITDTRCQDCEDTLMLDVPTGYYFSTLRGTEDEGNEGVTGFDCLVRPRYRRSDRRLLGYEGHRLTNQGTPPTSTPDAYGVVWYSTKDCCVCGEHDTLLLRMAELEKWKAGVFVQDAFPRLSAGKREQLVSGIHPDCWDSAVLTAKSSQGMEER